MKSLFIKFLSVVLIASFFSCEKVFQDDELSMKRTNYTGEELRTDGYYYYREQTEHDGVHYDRVLSMFLYRNGVAIYGGVYDYSESNFEKHEEQFKKGVYSLNYKDDKQLWHVFQVYGNTIEFEGWWYSGRGFNSLDAVKEIGKIHNDTTFEIINENGKKLKYTKIFRFKQFSPKPDSTNSFIK